MAFLGSPPQKLVFRVPPENRIFVTLTLRPCIHKAHSGFSTGAWTPGQTQDKLDTDFIHRITKWGYHWRQTEITDNDGSKKFEFRSISDGRSDCEPRSCTCDEKCYQDCLANFDESVEIDEFYMSNGSKKFCAHGWQTPIGYQACGSVACGNGTSGIESSEVFDWKTWTEPTTFPKISFPSDIATARNGEVF